MSETPDSIWVSLELCEYRSEEIEVLTRVTDHIADLKAQHTQTIAEAAEIEACLRADVARLLKSSEAVEERNADLEEAIHDAALCFEAAADDIDSWGAYAGEYFRDKHDLPACVQRYKNKARELKALEDN